MNASFIPDYVTACDNSNTVLARVFGSRGNESKKRKSSFTIIATAAKFYR